MTELPIYLQIAIYIMTPVISVVVLIVLALLFKVWARVMESI